MFDTFPIKNGLKQGDTLLLLLFMFALDNAIRWVKQNGRYYFIGRYQQVPTDKTNACDSVSRWKKLQGGVPRVLILHSINTSYLY